MKKKVIIICFSVIILIGILIFGIRFFSNRRVIKTGIIETKIEVDKSNARESGDNLKINTSNKLNNEKSIEGFKISNINFEERSGESFFVADVTNTSNADKMDYTYFKITFLDKNGNNIVTVPGIVNPVKYGGTVRLETKLSGEISNYIYASDFIIKEEK